MDLQYKRCGLKATREFIKVVDTITEIIKQLYMSPWTLK